MNNQVIVVTGGFGFLGRKVVEEATKQYPSSTVIPVGSKDADLRIADAAHSIIQRLKPDVVIHTAARLGGIGDNQKYPASYLYDNLIIGINLIEACRHNHVKKLINIGTVCSYPKTIPVPFKEENLWNGYPEPTNGAYGIAKKTVMEYAIAANKQYGLKTVNLLMTNLYGPGDDFREETSHVIPALIKKMINAKESDQKEVVAWGDGSPTRDFLYVEDAAQGVVQSISCDYVSPINIGSGTEISIKELFSLIAKHVDYRGTVVWDTSKPNGQPKRLLDISKASELFSFQPITSFEIGIEKTIKWYVKNRLEIDSLKPKYLNEFNENTK